MYEEQLRAEVEALFGARITNAGDCKRLSEKIQLITDQRLSDQTLRRFWGLIPATSKIKIATKDILSKYVGCADFEHFVYKQTQQIQAPPAINFDLVIRMFENNKVDENEYHLWHEGFSQILVEFIFSNQQLYELFVTKLHTNSYAMKFVMAEYFYYHLLGNDWYLKGLERFTKHSKVLHHKVYYLSMELTKYMLQAQPERMPKLLYEAFLLMGDLKVQPTIPFPLVGSVFGLAIYYHHTQNNESTIHQLLQEIDEIHRKYKKVRFETFFTTDAMVRTMVEILLWAGCIEIADYISKKYGLQVQYDKKINKTIQQLQLIQQLIIAVHQLQHKQCMQLLQTIDIESVRFDLKPIYSVLLMLCQLSLLKPTSKQKIAKLIAQIEQDCATHKFAILSQQVPYYLNLCGKW